MIVISKNIKIVYCDTSNYLYETDIIYMHADVNDKAENFKFKGLLIFHLKLYDSHKNSNQLLKYLLQYIDTIYLA